MGEKETKTKKIQLLNEGTDQKLKIRKAELEKEWQRVDLHKTDNSERET